MHALQNAERNKKEEIDKYRKNEIEKDSKLEQEINEFNAKKNQYHFRSQELLSSFSFISLLQ